MLVLFDFPNAIISSERRSATNVPSQQLFFLNSKVILDQSRLLAERPAGKPERTMLPA